MNSLFSTRYKISLGHTNTADYTRQAPFIQKCGEVVIYKVTDMASDEHRPYDLLPQVRCQRDIRHMTLLFTYTQIYHERARCQVPRLESGTQPAKGLTQLSCMCYAMSIIDTLSH